MALFDMLRRLVGGVSVPEETRRLFSSARSTKELLTGLDHLLTENEVVLRELDHEIGKLERLEREEVERIRSGELSERQKRNALLTVQRLRKQMDAYEKRQRIYGRNIDMHLNLIHRIQDIEAMQLRGVDEARIDQVIMSFEENLEKYNETLNAASVLEATKVHGVSAEEDRALLALERQLSGVAAPEEALEAPVAAAAAHEPAERAPRPREAAIEHAVERELRGEDSEAEAARHRELDRIERELLEE